MSSRRQCFAIHSPTTSVREAYESAANRTPATTTTTTTHLPIYFPLLGTQLVYVHQAGKSGGGGFYAP